MPQCNVSEEIYDILIALISASAGTLESLEIRVSYPNDNPVNLGTDGYGGERISHYRGQSELLRILPTLTRLRKLHYDFFPKSFFESDDACLPPYLTDFDVRVVVAGIGHRDFSPDQKSIMLEILKKVPLGMQHIRIRTIGVDESNMLAFSELVPYSFLSPLLNFDLLIPPLFSAWEETGKFNKLESLCFEGPQIGITNLLRSIHQTHAQLARFLALVPRIRKLHVTNAISEFTEESIVEILTRCIHLRSLHLMGESEKVTDNILCKISDPSTQIYAHIWSSGSFRSLRLPLTRYVSGIGLASIEQALSRNRLSGVDVTLLQETFVSGRDYILIDSSVSTVLCRF